MPSEEEKWSVMIRESQIHRSEESILREGLHLCSVHNEKLLLENQMLRLEIADLQGKIAAYEEKLLQAQDVHQANGGAATSEQAPADEQVQGGLAETVRAEARQELSAGPDGVPGLPELQPELGAPPPLRETRGADHDFRMDLL